MIATRRRLAALLVIGASCARTPVVANDPVPETLADSVPITRKPYVISKAELEDPIVQSMDALRAVQFLRPAFFRRGGPQSFVNPTAGTTQISQDYGPLQPLAQLRWFDVLMLYEVQYLEANEAQMRFGINANGGAVILLLTHKP